MMTNLLTYSNGWGHLIMSTLCLIVGILLLVITPDPVTHATGIGLISTVSGYWFVTSSAKQIAVEISKALTPDTQNTGNVSPVTNIAEQESTK